MFGLIDIAATFVIVGAFSFIAYSIRSELKKGVLLP